MSGYIVNGSEEFSKYNPTTQVYKATHDGAGRYLPFMYRSFISFSYGGKNIEDFDLIATIDGDRLSRNIYADFEDLAETYPTIEGQLYWGTHFTNNHLDLVLSTDGITQKQLDDFKEWFAPGVEKELILAEHPNRAIMARVAATPSISVLPFEHESFTYIAGEKMTTSITLFKGNISLSFVMDEPHWYAKVNVISQMLEGYGANGILNIHQDPNKIKDIIDEIIKNAYTKKVLDEHGNLVEAKESAYITVTYKDENNDLVRKNVRLKTPIEGDSIEVFDSNIDNFNGWYWYLHGFITKEVVGSDGKEETNLDITYPDDIKGIETIFNIENDKDIYKIILEDNIPTMDMLQDSVMLAENLVTANADYGSKVFDSKTGLGARVGSLGYVGIESSGNNSTDLTMSSPLYLYYCGTAIEKPVVTFTFTPKIDEDSGYIIEPRNSYKEDPDSDGEKYNYIAIDNNKFYFTLPSLLTGYNQALKIVNSIGNNDSAIDLLTYLREGINEYYSRAWAIYCYNKAVNITGNVDSATSKIINASSFKSDFIREMRNFIINNDNITSVTCTFNSKTGEAVGEFEVNVAQSNSQTNFQKIEENIGDMARADYLKIEGRNYPNSTGFITYRECHKITTNYSSKLKRVVITFQNKYL